MNDKQIKEEMENMDPLSGGIVYAKEEAWDRLQARMDKKPARKIVLWQRLAAAAVLLLMVGIIGVYYYPEQQIAANEPVDLPVKSDTETMIVSTPMSVETIPAPIETLIVNQEKSVVAKHERQPIQLVIETPKPEAPALPADTVKQIAVAAVVQPAPAKPTVKKMRVVHINDLGKYEDGSAYAVEYTGPGLDIRKMKVVSIYDMQSQEQQYMEQQEMITVMRINRPHVLFALPNSLSRKDPYRNSIAQNRLSIRLNRNN